VRVEGKFSILSLRRFFGIIQIMLTQVDFVAGDIVKVHQKIREGAKTRVQIFKGTVLGLRGRGENKTFTVQKMVGQIAVEKIWPINSPSIEKVEVAEKPKKRIRRAKLTYLRDLKR
jgi:large subunit ribosomal protein L19